MRKVLARARGEKTQTTGPENTKAQVRRNLNRLSEARRPALGYGTA